MKDNIFVKVLGPGFGVIILGSVVENFILWTHSFLLGALFGLIWLLLGIVGIALALKKLKKSEGFMLVESGIFSVSRNPIMAATLFGVMPGLCLVLNTNIGILGIAASVFLFFKHIGSEELVLEDKYGEAYQAYSERVCRLLPCSLPGMN